MRLDPIRGHDHLTSSPSHGKNQGSVIFQQILQSKEQLVISKHAKQRLAERNIEFGAEQWFKIQQSVSEAKKKGISDSLVITSNAALIVSAKNNTVITAMDREEAKLHLFTNINGTIIID